MQAISGSLSQLNPQSSSVKALHLAYPYSARIFRQIRHSGELKTPMLNEVDAIEASMSIRLSKNRDQQKPAQRPLNDHQVAH